MKNRWLLLTLPVLVCCGLGNSGRAEAPVRVIVDADTANEIDDLYAIVRAVVAPEFQVEGLTSAHFTRSTKPNETVHRSQQINEQLLDAMGLRNAIPHPVDAAIAAGKFSARAGLQGQARNGRLARIETNSP